jgi:hypothetical protein
MNVEIGAEAVLFPEKEHKSGIFVAVWDRTVGDISSWHRICMYRHWGLIPMLEWIYYVHINVCKNNNVRYIYLLYMGYKNYNEYINS